MSTKTAMPALSFEVRRPAKGSTAKQVCDRSELLAAKFAIQYWIGLKAALQPRPGRLIEIQAIGSYVNGLTDNHLLPGRNGLDCSG